METMYCPLNDEECKAKKCMWYVSVQEQCSVLSIAEDLREIAEHLEEINNEN